jgi:hypothetical protein
VILPYGLYKDLSTWLGSTVEGWLLLIAYGVWNWRRGKIRVSYLVALVLLIVATSLIGYMTELAGISVVRYVASGVIGFFPSLMLLPSIAYVVSHLHPYDRPLLLAWLVMTVAALLFGTARLKKRRELREPRSRAP